MATEPQKADLVERLRNPVFVLDAGAEYLNEEAARAVMREAADEIEHLRRLAGAVSRGESFMDIRKQSRS
ncbi:MAG TPA: hypothetical protein VH592_04675 [Gemmataceae bacterium]|jgi:hypothetical protein